jgi:CRP/FNR family nitrogen fixation transcriptional regulator
MGAPMRFARNSEIYGEHEPAEYLYQVISGAVRTYRMLDDGRRQISAFYLPGDIFGVEAGDVHLSSAEAISDAQVLVAKRSAVMSRAEHEKTLARQLCPGAFAGSYQERGGACRRFPARDGWSKCGRRRG